MSRLNSFKNECISNVMNVMLIMNRNESESFGRRVHHHRAETEWYSSRLPLNSLSLI